MNLGSPSTQRYIERLKTLKLRPRGVRLHKNILLEHDNAKPHTSRPATEATEKLDRILPLITPAMQSRLGATRLPPFSKMNEGVRGHLYDSIEEVDCVVSLGAGVGSLVDRAEVVDRVRWILKK